MKGKFYLVMMCMFTLFIFLSNFVNELHNAQLYFALGLILSFMRFERCLHEQD